jgi:hypothetical protein
MGAPRTIHEARRVRLTLLLEKLDFLKEPLCAELSSSTHLLESFREADGE